MSSTFVDTQSEAADAAFSSNRLRSTMTAARLSFTWFGVRKTLTARQKEQAADSFGAEGKYLSAGKKLLDTTHPAFRSVTAIKGRAVNYWKQNSLPYPEPGIRLIRRESIDDFHSGVEQFRSELIEAVAQLDQHYDELKQAAESRLGDLFNRADYPETLIGSFAVECDFPSVEPPGYLRHLNPELYQQECRRMQDRFDEAVRLTEAAFTEELAQLVDHLSERLNGDVDGKPKVFRDSVVENLEEFFQRFQQLNIHSSEQLDDLVERARQLMNGVDPQQLRRSQPMRQQVATGLAGVQSSLDQLLVNRPRRNILRRPR